MMYIISVAILRFIKQLFVDTVPFAIDRLFSCDHFTPHSTSSFSFLLWYGSALSHMPSLRRVAIDPLTSTNNAVADAGRASPVANAQDGGDAASVDARVTNSEKQSESKVTILNPGQQQLRVDNRVDNHFLCSDSRSESTSGVTVASVSAKKGKPSRFVGVTATKNGRYHTQLCVDSHVLHVGSYLLECDSALAYDEAVRYCRILEVIKSKGPPWTLNFALHDEYHQARSIELQARGISSNAGLDPSALVEKVKRHVDSFVANKVAGSASIGNDASNATRKGPTSRYRYVSLSKQNSKYVVQMKIEGKVCYGGSYQLETDAAYATDQMIKQLVNNRGHIKMPNFETIEEYHQARAKELRVRELDDHSGPDLATLNAKVQKRIDALVNKGNSHVTNHATIKTKEIASSILDSCTDATTHKRKREEMYKNNRKKCSTEHSHPRQAALDKLNAKTDALNKKW